MVREVKNSRATTEKKSLLNFRKHEPQSGQFSNQIREEYACWHPSPRIVSETNLGKTHSASPVPYFQIQVIVSHVESTSFPSAIQPSMRGNDRIFLFLRPTKKNTPPRL
ncbi:DUF1661 domain-containing protein [Porphyromonas gulae]|uniref:DUF1661 domain-containing protein n=1 Tax=Porphyromonas gulae TaxID=111105 RepID=UPI001F1D0A72|nr:DUF1661 domain-containing protein [Porphyromonas gulae]